MAIYRLEVKSISRKSGRSATAAAAYRSGSRIEDDRTGEAHNYTRRRGVDHAEILLPEKAPAAFKDRSTLWNEAEAAERRKDAKVAREIIVALPHELDREQRVALCRIKARHIVERYGVGVDLAIHAPDREGDQRNWHCHFLFTTRQIEADGMKAKTRLLDVKKTSGPEVEHMRKFWAQEQNAALDKAGIDQKVDHRSLADQGVDRIPEPKLGPVATEIERKGRKSRAGDDLRRVRAENAALAAAVAQRNAVDLEIARMVQAEQAQTRQADPKKEREFFVAATLEQSFGAEEAKLSIQAEALRNRLEGQGRVSRFWYDLTGRNDKDRFELQSLETSLIEVRQKRADAAAMLQAQEVARQAGEKTHRQAQEAEQVRPEQIPANDVSGAPEPSRQAVGDNARPRPSSLEQRIKQNARKSRGPDIDFDI